MPCERLCQVQLKHMCAIAANEPSKRSQRPNPSIESMQGVLYTRHILISGPLIHMFQSQNLSIFKLNGSPHKSMETDPSHLG